MSALLSSTSARALFHVLNRGNNPALNPHIYVLDYRDSDTFASLWLYGLSGLGTLEIEKGAGEHRPGATGENQLTGTARAEAEVLSVIPMNSPDTVLIIVGNEPPEAFQTSRPESLQGINFSDHFTAASWLAAWKVKNYVAPDGREQWQPLSARIVVIDPRPMDLARSPVGELASLLGAKASDEKSLAPRAAVLNQPSLRRITRWIACSADEPTDTPPAIAGLLKSTIWNALVARGDQHHAISNVVGPVLLSTQPEEESASHTTLLRRLLAACGFVPWKASDSLQEIDESLMTASEAQPPEAGGDLSILLIDDQAKHGWEDWLKETLSGAASSIKTETDPKCLVDAITTGLGANGGKFEHKDARFRLNLPQLENAIHPVLLLDLRLFSGKQAEEIAFYQSLLPLVEHFTDKSDLAWPDFSTTHEERDRLFRDTKAAVAQGKLNPDTPEHHEALTWLPRLVALTDMSLPIVLFSSTGRRDLVEQFKAYGNIITKWEKPRLVDLVNHATKDAHQQLRLSSCVALRAAVADARNWLRLRSVVQNAQNSGTPAAPRIAQDDAKHFEIYFDESGSSRDNGFRIGTLIVGYRSQDHALDLAKRMHDAGISWFNESGGTFLYDKNESREPQAISKWSGWITPFLNELWMLPLVLWASPESQATASDAFNADTLLQSLVGEVVEMCLFLLLPMEKDISYAIYGAQRRIGVEGTQWTASGLSLAADFKSQTVPERTLREWNISIPGQVAAAIERFTTKWALHEETHIVFRVEPLADKSSTAPQQKTGFERAKCEALLQSVMSALDYGGIIARAFQTRPWTTPWNEQSSRVFPRFSPLNHEERARINNLDRPIHFLADVLPGDAVLRGTSPTLNATTTLFCGAKSEPLILISQGREMSLLLGAGRALDGQDLALALATAESLKMDWLTSARRLYQCVRQKLVESVERMNGGHLINAFHLLEASKASKTAEMPLPFAKVNITHQHWTRYPGPTEAQVAALQEYAKSRLVVELKIGKTALEAHVAEWVIKTLFRKEYPNVTISGNVVWMEDTSDKCLFAVVPISPPATDIPFRRWSLDLPGTLRLGSNEKLTIKASTGTIPLPRLVVSGAEIGWENANSVTLEDKGWTEAQIESVSQRKFVRCFFSPTQNQKLQMVQAANERPVKTVPNSNGTVFFFRADSFCEALKNDMKACRPEDFDQQGQLLPPSAAATPDPKCTPAQAIAESIPKEVEATVPDRVLLGPVPTTINSKKLCTELLTAHPGWRTTEDWKGSKEQGWWLVLTRATDGAVLPKSVTLLGHSFTVREDDGL